MVKKYLGGVWQGSSPAKAPASKGNSTPVREKWLWLLYFGHTRALVVWSIWCGSAGFVPLAVTEPEPVQELPVLRVTGRGVSGTKKDTTWYMYGSGFGVNEMNIRTVFSSHIISA